MNHISVFLMGVVRRIGCVVVSPLSLLLLSASVATSAPANDSARAKAVPVIISMLLFDEATSPPAPVPSMPSFVQKGPFRAGAMATITPLDNMNMVVAPNIVATTGDRGVIRLTQPLPSATLWAWVSVDGMAFNENTGLDESTHLEGLMPVENGTLTGNLNVFSWLVGARARAISDDVDQELSLAIIEAQRQAQRAVGLYAEPQDIDVLVDRAFNAHALLFSAALLRLPDPRQSLATLVSDFMDDGRINTVQGGTVLEGLAFRSTQETLDTAIANINAEYGVNLSARVATGLLPLENVPCGDQVCVGNEQSIEVIEPQEVRFVPVKVFQSGTYALQVIHSTFNLFHTGILQNSLEVDVESLGQGGTPVLPLEAGDTTIEGGARNNSSQDDIMATFRLFRVGDGTEQTPQYVPTNRPHFGMTSQRGGQASAYYEIDAAPSFYRVKLSDVRSNDAFRITVTDSSGTVYQKAGNGGVILDFESIAGSSKIQVQYTDAAQVNQAGSIDFQLAVTAISQDAAEIDLNTIINN